MEMKSILSRLSPWLLAVSLAGLATLSFYVEGGDLSIVAALLLYVHETLKAKKGQTKV